MGRPPEDAAQRLRNAGLLLRADIPCHNGCGCEGYDYCAADEWDTAIVLERVAAGGETETPPEGTKP